MTTSLYGYTDAGEQAWMVLDEVRTSRYAAAIRQVVKPDDVVLDIGSGSGILALLAARAGARRVYAVERSAIAALAERNIARNGFADVVEILRQDLLETAALPERPTVVLGEMLGHFASDEHMHRLYGHARKLAAPGARFIPSGYSLTWGAISAHGLSDEMNRLTDIEGIDLSAMGELLVDRIALAHIAPEDLLGTEVTTAPVDVLEPLPARYSATLRIEQDGELGAIAVGFDAQLAPGVNLRTGVADARTHWRQTVFPVHPPLPVRSGQSLDVAIRPRLITDRGTWAWQVTAGEQTRKGDAMRAQIGSKADLVAALGLKTGQDDIVVSRKLEAYAAMCEGSAPTSVAEATSRLMQTCPERYNDQADAEQDAWAFFRAASAVKAAES